MAQMPESKESESGDDDKVYLFFSETAVECDCYNKLVVSRVARVCKVIKGFTLHALPMTMAHKWHFHVLLQPFPLFHCYVYFSSCYAFLCSQGDLGGQRTLQKKWTTFLKARIDCPVLESQLPYIIRDAYRWCDPEKDWKSCIFYTVFTAQS